MRCRDGSVQALEEVGGPPLGLIEDLEYDETTFELRPGDVLAFYTDGITEAMDARGVQFGTTRLDEILSRCHLTRRGRSSRRDRGGRGVHRSASRPWTTGP